MHELLDSLRRQPLWTALGAIVLLFLAVLPLGQNDYVRQVVMIGYFFVIQGISWNILAGYTGQFCLAQHAFATIGAYTSAAVVLALGLPLPLGILAGVIVAALL